MSGGDGAAAVGDKRKKQWKSGGQDNKRHKGALSCATTAKGSSGILVTCDRTKERQCVRDALNILNELADKHYPKAEAAKVEHDEAEDEADGGGSSASVQKLLQEEVAALKADAKKRKTGRFTALDTGVKGVLLIQILDAELSAVDLVTKMLEEVEETKEFASRFINRVIPLEKIGYASAEDIKAIAEPLLQSFVAKYQADDATKDTPIEYSVEIKRRNCTHLESRPTIELLAGLMGAEHKVNLSTPNVVILVEVFRTTFGISVVTNFHKFRKFNVRSVIEPPVSTQPVAKDSTDAKTSTAEEDKNGQEEN